jgi:predicted HD phosphohydrolase
MKTLVSPDQLPAYGFPRYSNRHRKRLEDQGVLPPRVPITYHRHAYVEEELQQKAKDAIAKRDAAKVAAE